MLGFNSFDSYRLKLEFEKQAEEKYARGEYVLKRLNNYGQNVDIVIELDSETRKGVKFISGWKVNPLGYLTCNTPLGDN